MPRPLSRSARCRGNPVRGSALASLSAAQRARSLGRAGGGRTPRAPRRPCSSSCGTPLKASGQRSAMRRTSSRLRSIAPRVLPTPSNHRVPRYREAGRTATGRALNGDRSARLRKTRPVAANTGTTDQQPETSREGPHSALFALFPQAAPELSGPHRCCELTEPRWRVRGNRPLRTGHPLLGG